MSKNGKENIVMVGGNDQEMQQAYNQARSTFRYLWRELSWENRRIVPALDIACVKAVFADCPYTEIGPNDPVEQMWISDIDFNGYEIAGTLLNSPDYLRSLKEGDFCRFPIHQLTDWIYAIDGKVYGAYTVNLIRSRMSYAERKSHDKAWGLDFGDPKTILVVPDYNENHYDQFMKPVVGNGLNAEHPMSINMGPELVKYIARNPNIVNEQDNQGWTMLHKEALAGNTVMVDILLKHGADRLLRTANGDIALDLAKLMGWEKTIAVLSEG